MRWLLIVTTLSVRAETPCARCHPKQAEAFAASPMGRSMTASVPTIAETRFRHAASDTKFDVRGVVHGAERNGFRAEYPVAFAIGSGAHAQGYVVRIGGRLFQSPIASYRAHGSFDVAPGYESMTAPDFNRPVTADCLLCHSSPAGGEARQAITCDRCHGEAGAHLRKPAPGSIMNPAKLAAPGRDSVCEQCHLNGEARVPNPRAGFSVYVYDRPQGGLKVVSHVEQLALSACQRATQKLWCGTCHQVHGRAIDVSARCRQCHPSLRPGHPAASRTCTGCHMPKQPAKDGGHSAFTDHRIQRRATPRQETAPGGLRAWRDPADESLRQRNLGLAYVMVGERDGSAEFLNRGYRLLAGVYPKFPQDADVLASLGMVLYLKDQKADAAKLLRAAIAARPADAGLYEKLGVVLHSPEPLEKAIAIDPSRETAYHLLADLPGNVEQRRAVLERYLTFNPQSLIAREALQRLRLR